MPIIFEGTVNLNEDHTHLARNLFFSLFCLPLSSNLAQTPLASGGKLQYKDFAYWPPLTDPFSYIHQETKVFVRDANWDFYTPIGKYFVNSNVNLNRETHFDRNRGGTMVAHHFNQKHVWVSSFYCTHWTSSSPKATLLNLQQCLPGTDIPHLKCEQSLRTVSCKIAIFHNKV